MVSDACVLYAKQTSIKKHHDSCPISICLRLSHLSVLKNPLFSLPLKLVLEKWYGRLCSIKTGGSKTLVEIASINCESE